jgi:hypothetical protein
MDVINLIVVESLDEVVSRNVESAIILVVDKRNLGLVSSSPV